MNKFFVGSLTVGLAFVMSVPGALSAAAPSGANSTAAAVSAANDPYGSDDFDAAVPMPAPAGYVPNTGPARVAPSGAIKKVTTTKTNIVVIMVDDLAYMGNRIWDYLPALKDQFINQGIDFTNYYGNDPLCCPGRAGFLTGQYTDHHGVWTNDPLLFDPTETLATELKSVGYDTIISGKYFNQSKILPDKTPPGWTHSAIYGGGYYGYAEWVDGTTEYRGRATADYAPDVFTNQALQFIREAPPSKPIFAFLTPYDVHAGEDQNGKKTWNLPVTAPRYKNDPRCYGVGKYDPPSYDEADVSDKPAYIQDMSGLVASHYPQGWPLKPLCTALLAVNDEFVRVKHELKLDGRLKNTLFVLTTDNGMAFGAHGWPKKDVPYAEQVNLFVSWPAARGTAPAVSNAYLANVDAAPTLCEVGGCVMGPYPNGQKTSDGQSFLGLIAPSRSTSVPVRDALYQEHRLQENPRPRWRDIRTTPGNPLGLWHYVVYDNGECELYDMQADPWELNNECNQPWLAGVQTALETRLAAFVTNVKPGVP